MSLFIARVVFVALSLIVLGIATLIAWLAAKGFPRSWDRDTFVLAFPVYLFIGGGGFYIAQRWQPLGDLPFALKEILGYGSFVVLGISGGCMLAIFTHGRLIRRPTDRP